MDFTRIKITEKAGMVAVACFDNELHQNCQLFFYFCSLRFFEILKLILAKYN